MGLPTNNGQSCRFVLLCLIAPLVCWRSRWQPPAPIACPSAAWPLCMLGARVHGAELACYTSSVPWFVPVCVCLVCLLWHVSSWCIAACASVTVRLTPPVIGAFPFGWTCALNIVLLCCLYCLLCFSYWFAVILFFCCDFICFPFVFLLFVCSVFVNLALFQQPWFSSRNISTRVEHHL